MPSLKTSNRPDLSPQSSTWSYGLVDITTTNQKQIAAETLPGKTRMNPGEFTVESQLPELMENLSGGSKLNDQTLSSLKPPIQNLAILDPITGHAIADSILQQLPKIQESLPPHQHGIIAPVETQLKKIEDNQNLLMTYRQALISS